MVELSSHYPQPYLHLPASYHQQLGDGTNPGICVPASVSLQDRTAPLPSLLRCRQVGGKGGMPAPVSGGAGLGLGTRGGGLCFPPLWLLVTAGMSWVSTAVRSHLCSPTSHSATHLLWLTASHYQKVELGQGVGQSGVVICWLCSAFSGSLLEDLQEHPNLLGIASASSLSATPSPPTEGKICVLFTSKLT